MKFSADGFSTLQKRDTNSGGREFERAGESADAASDNDDMRVGHLAKDLSLPNTLGCNWNETREHGFSEVAVLQGRLNCPQVGTAAGILIHIVHAVPDTEGRLPKKRCFAEAHCNPAAPRCGQGYFGGR
jgi:hypothetical protein